MLCSILIPSRGRPDKLVEALKSIRDAVSNQNEVEAVLRLDSDDITTLSRRQEFESFPNVKITVGNRENGYASLSRFYTIMAKQSKAKWIFIFNDDAVIIGKDWDKQLSEIPTTGFIVHPEMSRLNNSGYPKCAGAAFPIVPNQCWTEFKHPDGYFIPEIESPADSKLHELLVDRNGWQTHFVEGMEIRHNREESAFTPQEYKYATEVKSEVDPLLTLCIHANVFGVKNAHALTSAEAALQTLVASFPQGKVIPPHTHLPTKRTTIGTQESILVMDGLIKADIYDVDEKWISYFILGKGDMLITLAGGHRFETLKSAHVVEIKNGPYLGKEADYREINVQN